MNLSGLLPFIDGVPAYQQLVANLQLMLNEPEPAPLSGTQLAQRVQGLDVISSARPYLLAALYRQLSRPMLLLTARAERVNHWIDQLRIWTSSSTILPFPEPDPLPYERVPWSRETLSDRLGTQTALAAFHSMLRAGTEGDAGRIVFLKLCRKFPVSL